MPLSRRKARIAAGIEALTDEETSPLRGRLFIVESPNAADLLDGRQEAATLVNACRIIGYAVASFVVRSAAEFKATCKYIAQIDTQSEESEPPLFVHISAHGCETGLAFGPDTITWEDIADILADFCPMSMYNGSVILVLSACAAGRQSFTTILAHKFKKNGRNFIPLKYVFVTDESEVAWADALIAWTMFYQQIDRAGLDRITKVQEALGRVAASANVKMKYFRWDAKTKSYRHHAAAI